MNYLFLIFSHGLRKKEMGYCAPMKIFNSFRLRYLERKVSVFYIPSIVLLFFTNLIGKRNKGVKPLYCDEIFFSQRLRNNEKKLGRVISCGVCR